MYYVIVFFIIFIPCIIAFIWLNSIIAKQLWNRRHSVGYNRRRKRNRSKRILRCLPYSSAETTKRKCNCKSTKTHNTDSTPAATVSVSLSSSSPTSQQPTPSASNREARHIRMFTIILLMMAVFIFLRLPAWVFLIMRMYGSYSRPIHWILYFSFGILNLCSCVLNPLFYTFLAKTIHYALCIKGKLWDDICGLRICCKKMPSNNQETCSTCCQCSSSIEACCICCIFNSSLRCYRPPKAEQQQNDNLSSPRASPDAIIIDKEPQLFMEHDEGVECNSEASEEDEENNFCEIHDYEQRIYTIYPASLVSSSVNSQV